MKPYIFSILCSFLSILCNPISAINDKELLIELDEVIKDQKIYEQYMEDKIKASNQKVFFTVDNPQQQFEALGELFELYRSYRTDQALSIAEQRVQLSKQLDEQSYRKAVMNKADALNKMGYYNEARELLEQMNTEKQLESDIYACYLFHTIYLSLYNEATIPQQKNTYREKWPIIPSKLLNMHNQILIHTSQTTASNCNTKERPMRPSIYWKKPTRTTNMKTIKPVWNIL